MQEKLSDQDKAININESSIQKAFDKFKELENDIQNQLNKNFSGTDELKKIKDLERRLEVLEQLNTTTQIDLSKIEQTSGGSLDSSQVFDILKQMQKEMLDKMVTRSQFDYLQNQLS